MVKSSILRESTTFSLQNIGFKYILECVKQKKSSEGSISTLYTILDEKIFFKKACLSILYFYPCFLKKIDTYIHFG